MKCHMPEEETKATGNLNMNLYDLNKQIVAQLSGLTEEQLTEKTGFIADYHAEREADYYMLLCNELKYYTVFAIQDNYSEPVFEEEVICCLNNFADEIKSIELTEDGCALEIWITKDGEAYAMYLFDYTMGVIECG